MDALLQQFFNIDIMVQAAPLIFRGLAMTLLVCAAVVPLGLIGGTLWLHSPAVLARVAFASSWRF